MTSSITHELPAFDADHNKPHANVERYAHVAHSVQLEVGELSAQGYDVQLSDTPDIYRPDTARQELIDEEIAHLEASPTGSEEFRERSGIKYWGPLTKRAIALHTLYNPMSKTIGQGISKNAYDLRLFDGMSATDVLNEQLGAEKAKFYIDAYRAFIPAAIDEGTLTEVGSRDFFRGVKDAQAVRTRATAATRLVTEHIMTVPELAGRDDLVSASMACGAAGPVYEMATDLQSLGHNFSDIILVDQDPMALATAHSLAEAKGVDDKIRLEIRDLLAEKFNDYIAPNSVDVVDLLGLFEYIPNNDKIGRYAAELLRQVKTIVRPGGYIVFGNMLNERPQQQFFSKVVKWPRLQQRTVSQVMEIVAEAGFNPRDMQVRIPSEGVYAIYGIKVPLDTERKAIHTSVTTMIGKNALPRY